MMGAAPHRKHRSVLTFKFMKLSGQFQQIAKTPFRKLASVIPL